MTAEKWTDEEHIDNLVRHIRLVQDAGLLLAKRMMANGRKDFGRVLLGQIFTHDNTKFHGIEWDYLHTGPGVPQDTLKLAIRQHQATNSHHPEHHGGIENMNEYDIAEMVCDWYARSQEMGTDLRNWIKDTAMPRYNIKPDSDVHKMIIGFVDMLLRRAIA